MTTREHASYAANNKTSQNPYPRKTPANQTDVQKQL